MCKVLILELGFLSDEKGEEGDDMTVKSTRDVWACRSFLEVHLPGAINKELSENVEGFWKLASVGQEIGPSKCVMKMVGVKRDGLRYFHFGAGVYGFGICIALLPLSLASRLAQAIRFPDFKQTMSSAYC